MMMSEISSEGVKKYHIFALDADTASYYGPALGASIDLL